MRKIRVAYDVTWSSRPVYATTDCLAVGWIAADKDSHEVVTKTNSTVIGVDYWVDNMIQCGSTLDKMETCTNGVTRAKFDMNYKKKGI